MLRYGLADAGCYVMRCDRMDYGYDTTTHMDVLFDAILWYVEWYG